MTITIDAPPDAGLELDGSGLLGAYCYRAAAAVELLPGEHREISVVAVPYDEPADIQEATRHYVETIDPKAFVGVERRISGRSKVTVNREHDPARTVGKVIRLDPHGKHGLAAVLRLTRGLALADETLALAADDVLSASVCFSTMAGGEQWSSDRTTKRVTRAYLHHIALVPEPAYQGAVVTSVRSADQAAVDVSVTPWLDEMRAQRLAAHYGVLLTP